MQEHIRERVLTVSNYMIESGATVRQAAGRFGVSKSTIHKDVTERLPLLNEMVARKVRGILDNNKAERHLRGGAATRQKYLDRRESHNGPSAS